jgi:hypothetical protein
LKEGNDALFRRHKVLGSDLLSYDYHPHYSLPRTCCRRTPIPCGPSPRQRAAPNVAGCCYGTWPGLLQLLPRMDPRERLPHIGRGRSAAATIGFRRAGAETCWRRFRGHDTRGRPSGQGRRCSDLAYFGPPRNCEVVALDFQPEIRPLSKSEESTYNSLSSFRLLAEEMNV